MRLPSLDEIVAERCRRSYAHFVRTAWPNIPRLASRELKWNWHHGAVCDHAQAVAQGKLRFLLVNMPPGSLKTELLGVFFLPWIWTWRPGYSQISASLVANLATETSVRCREIVECEWYQRVFVRGNWALRDDKNAKNDFANDVGGGRLATSVGAQVIGRRGDLITGDDLQSDGQSQKEWDDAWDYWTGELSSRAVEPSTVAKVIVQQRLGKGDISDRILEHGGYEHLCIRDAYDPRKVISTSIGWKDPRTREGELLNPRLDPPEVAERTRAEAVSYGKGMGPHKARAQLDQDPAVNQGGKFPRAKWRFYHHPMISGTHRPAGCATAEEAPAVEMPRKWTAKCLSMDTAVAPGAENDWTVVGCVATDGARVFVMPWLDRQKVDIMGMERMLEAQCEREPDAGAKYVEGKASGTPLVQRLRNRIRGLQTVDPGRGSKTERAEVAILPSLSASQVYLPEGAPWLDAFVEEFADFPGGRHDDMVDFLAQAMAKLVGSGKGNWRDMYQL